MDNRLFTVLPVGELEVRTETNRDQLYTCWMCSVLVPTGASVVHYGLPCGHAVHEDCLKEFATNTDASIVLCKCQRQFRIPTAVTQAQWFGTLSAPPTTSTAEEIEAEREATRQRRLERGFAKTRRPSAPSPHSGEIPQHIWNSLVPVDDPSREWNPAPGEISTPRADGRMVSIAEGIRAWREWKRNNGTA